MFLTTLATMFSPLHLILILFGAVVGMIMGAIPGMSGTLAITVILPMTFSMDWQTSLCLLCGIWIGSASGSFIGSILLGIPGTPSSIATVYDGYEFTKQGDPVRALSAGTVANFIGTTPSLIVAAVASPLIARWAVKMGPWEYFGLAFCAIVMVVSLSKGNVFGGFIVTAIALMVRSVGYSPISSTPRFTFNNYYLAGGFSLVCVMTGIFAGSTILLEYARGEKAKSDSSRIKVSRFRWPGKDFADNKLNVLVSFLIGLWIGFLPGLGGSMSNLLAYSTARNMSKHPEKFGTGCIDGVIAPEVANNASVGGAVIPFVALGIPGDATTAVLLGALAIQGIDTGPLIFRNAPEVVYLVIGVLMLGAIFLVLFEAAVMPLMPMILRVPYHFLYPLILVLCLLGAYSSTSNMFILWMSILFTLLGLFMQWAKLPNSPFMLTYVLGTILESNLRKAVSYGAGSWLPFVTRPVSLILLLVSIGSLVLPALRKKPADAAAETPAEE